MTTDGPDLHDHERRLGSVEKELDRQKQETQRQWEKLGEQGERLAANEAGMDRLWKELKAFRREAHDDAQAIHAAIAGKVSKTDDEKPEGVGGRLRQVEDQLALRRGALRLIAWIIGAGVPSGAALAGLYARIMGII